MTDFTVETAQRIVAEYDKLCEVLVDKANLFFDKPQRLSVDSIDPDSGAVYIEVSYAYDQWDTPVFNLRELLEATPESVAAEQAAKKALEQAEKDRARAEREASREENDLRMLNELATRYGKTVA